MEASDADWPLERAQTREPCPQPIVSQCFDRQKISLSLHEQAHPTSESLRFILAEIAQRHEENAKLILLWAAQTRTDGLHLDTKRGCLTALLLFVFKPSEHRSSGAETAEELMDSFVGTDCRLRTLFGA